MSAVQMAARMKWPAAAAVGVAVLLSGCSNPTGVVDYLGDRGGDALEVVGVQGGLAANAGVEFRATPFIRVPIGLLGRKGWLTGAWFGLTQGRFKKQMADHLVGVPLGKMQLVPLAARLIEDNELPGELISVFHWPKRFPKLVRWLDVSVQLSALLRMRLTFSPGETVDFMLGFIGIDIAGDD